MLVGQEEAASSRMGGDTTSGEEEEEEGLVKARRLGSNLERSGLDRAICLSVLQSENGLYCITNIVLT